MGAACRVGSLFVVDGDLAATTRIGAGLLRKFFKVVYAGLAETWDFKDGQRESIGYVGVGIQF